MTTLHTNRLKNFWSLLKRSIKGTYMSVEPFHLFRYPDEQSFRYNERKATDAERFAMVLGRVSGKRLTREEAADRKQPFNPESVKGPVTFYEIEAFGAVLQD